MDNGEGFNESFHCLSRDYTGIQKPNERVLKTSVEPYGLAWSKSKELNTTRLYVTDRSLHTIRVLDALSGDIIHSFGTKGCGNGELNSPCGIALYKEWIVVADTGNHRIQVFSHNETPGGESILNTEFVLAFGGALSNDSPALLAPEPSSKSGELNNPMDVACSARGNIIVADTGNNRIQGFTIHGEFLWTAGGKGGQNGMFRSPVSISLNKQNEIFVCDKENHRIQVLTRRGKFIRKFGKRDFSKNSRLSSPEGVSVLLEDGHDVIICDSANNRVRIVSTFGVIGHCFRIREHQAHPIRACLVPNVGLFAITDKASVLKYADVKRVEVGDFGVLPARFFNNIWAYLDFSDAKKLGRSNTHLHDLFTKLRTAWRIQPLTLTGLQDVKTLFKKWARWTSPLKKIHVGRMDFETAFRLTICKRYGTKFWYSYEEHLNQLFQYYAKPFKYRNKDAAAETHLLQQPEYIVLLTYLEEVFYDISKWKDHSVFRKNQSKVLPRDAHLSKIEFRQKVERHQMDVLSNRLKKIF